MARGKKTGGRRPGSTNKTTAQVKAALVQAFEDVGGLKAFAAWGKKNRTEFYKLWAKLLPTEIANAGGEAFRVALAEEIVDANTDEDGPPAPRPVPVPS